MKTTNIFGLPETIARALVKQEEMYNAGKVDASVTQLIQPPQITILRKKHYKEMSRDVSENFWALLGSGVHYLLDLGRTEEMITEERLFLNIDGFTISGGIDVQEVEGNYTDIMDYKVTATYSVTNEQGSKDEWHNQLNLYALLVEANKATIVRSLTICAILRDWSGAKAKVDPFYPQAPIQLIDIPVWSRAKRLAYARERIALHREARFNEAMQEPLPQCSREERWMKKEKWAVLKIGGKRAVKVCMSEEEAKALVEEKGDGYHIEYRPGVSTRCGYCGVSKWCDQFAAMDNKDIDDE